MSIEDAAIFAAWTVLLLAMVAVVPHLRWRPRLDRPAARPLLLDPLDFDLDGPVIDMEPA